MDAPSQTSLVTTGEQSELFNELLMPKGLDLLQPEETQRKRFTAERVAHNQARYKAIVAALGQNLPVRMICDAFQVSHHIVKAIREREPELVATEKQRMSKLLGHAARMVAESFVEDLNAGKVPPQCKPVAAAIFLDKKALIDGEASMRIEHVHTTVPTLEEISRELRSLVEIEATTETQSDVTAPKTQ